MKKTTLPAILLLVVCQLAMLISSAQISLAGQLRTRTEMRNGQGTPLSRNAAPAFFTSQRTRLSFRYAGYRFQFNVTAQDVRVWGQDVSTINRTTVQDLNGVLFHEAWAEVRLNDTTARTKNLSLRIGRQELVYDDQRLLGNLDWLQQGRRHDAALVKYETGNWRLHIGAAYNQNRELASGTVYNSLPPGNYPATTNGGSMYKSMAFFYAGEKLKKGAASYLFFTDHFSRYHMDTSTLIKVFGNRSWTRATTGIYLNDKLGPLLLTASGYYQFGHSPLGKTLRAELLSAALQYPFSQKITGGAGVDFYSGGNSGTTSHTFDPLYGTPHKFAGWMDYYYAANGFGNKGLVDYYLKSRFASLSGRATLALDLHQFKSAAAVTGYATRNLGREIDFSGTYALTPQISFEGGYAHYFLTSLLTSAPVKNVPDAKPSADWAYVMVSIRPDFILK